MSVYFEVNGEPVKQPALSGEPIKGRVKGGPAPAHLLPGRQAQAPLAVGGPRVEGAPHQCAGRVLVRGAAVQCALCAGRQECWQPWRSVLCEVIGTPIKLSEQLSGEPIKGRVKTGASHSTAGDARSADAMPRVEDLPKPSVMPSDRKADQVIGKIDRGPVKSTGKPALRITLPKPSPSTRALKPTGSRIAHEP